MFAEDEPDDRFEENALPEKWEDCTEHQRAGLGAIRRVILEGMKRAEQEGLPDLTNKEADHARSVPPGLALTPREIAERAPGGRARDSDYRQRTLPNLVEKKIYHRFAVGAGRLARFSLRKFVHPAVLAGARSVHELTETQQEILSVFCRRDAMERLSDSEVLRFAGFEDPLDRNLRREVKKLADIGLLIHHEERGGYSPCGPDDWPADAPRPLYSHRFVFSDGWVVRIRNPQCLKCNRCLLATEPEATRKGQTLATVVYRCPEHGIMGEPCGAVFLSHGDQKEAVELEIGERVRGVLCDPGT